MISIAEVMKRYYSAIEILQIEAHRPEIPVVLRGNPADEVVTTERSHDLKFHN